MNEMSCAECVQEALKALQEETKLLQLALLGAQGAIDKQTFAALVRLADDLEVSVQSISILYGKYPQLVEEI